MPRKHLFSTWTGALALFLVSGGLAVANPMGMGLKAPDPQLKSKLWSKGSYAIELVAPPKHHINVDAPATLIQLGHGGTKAPASIDPKQVTFAMPMQTAVYTASVYLCDDAKTFCENHPIRFSWDAAAKAVALQQTREMPPASTGSASTGAAPTVNAHGFFVNEPEAALALAKAENRPLLIDFFGIWCPPCNELEQDVFSHESFRGAAKQFVKLKLDADSDVSWALKSKYKVGGYPTVVLATSDGDEIQRIVGYRPLKIFTRDVRAAWDRRAEPFAVLEAKAGKGDRKAADRLGRIYLERSDYESAEKFLTGTKAERESLAAARIGRLGLKKGDSATAKQEWEKAMAQAIRAFPGTPDSVSRRMELAGALAERAEERARSEALMTEAAKVALNLAKHPEKLVGLDYAPVDLMCMAADAYEELGKSEESKGAWKNAVAEYRKRVRSSSDRGNHLELAYALRKAGDIDGAHEIYRKMQELFPKEFTFFYSHAQMNLALDKLDEAERLASQAVEYSYGDNRLRSVQLLAKILRKKNRKPEALAAVKKALAEARLPEDPSNRTHRYVKALKDLETELN